MLLILFLLTAILAFYHVLVPYKQSREIRDKREFHERYKIYQLYWVRKYHPVLSPLSLQEIEENFDYRKAFDSIGRPRRHSRE